MIRQQTCWTCWTVGQVGSNISARRETAPENVSHPILSFSITNYIFDPLLRARRADRRPDVQHVQHVQHDRQSKPVNATRSASLPCWCACTVGHQEGAAAVNGFEDVPVDWAPAEHWVADDGTVTQHLQFIVPGIPVPKGNIIKSRYGAYHDPTKGIDDWLASVAAQARNAMRGGWRIRTRYNANTINLPKFGMAVYVHTDFVMPRPKTLSPPTWMDKDQAVQYRQAAKNGVVPHIKKPDTDKLLRAIGDACTGIVFFDDSQVVDMHGLKRYCIGDETPGAKVTVTSYWQAH